MNDKVPLYDSGMAELVIKLNALPYSKCKLHITKNNFDFQLEEIIVV